MNRLAFLTRGGLLLLLTGFWFSLPASAQYKNGPKRELELPRGPVKTVSLEYTLFEPNEMNGWGSYVPFKAKVSREGRIQDYWSYCRVMNQWYQTIYVYNDLNLPTEISEVRPHGFVLKRKYDPDGNLIEAYNYASTYLQFWGTYEYQDKGETIIAKVYDPSTGKVWNISTTHYDSKGNRDKVSFVDAQNHQDRIDATTYLYDNNQRLIRIEWSSNGKLQTIEKTDYDRQGKGWVRTILTATGKVQKEETHKWNPDGTETITILWFEVPQSSTVKWMLTRTYDAYQNWTEETYERWEGQAGNLRQTSHRIAKRTITYYDDEPQPKQ